MNLYFQTYGNGPSLIILHGLLGSSDNWHTVSRKLAGSFHVFAIDQRNHGRSPHSSEFSNKVMAQDIKEFMQQHGLSSTSLIGHSMGGKVAMTLALKYSDLVDKLVVVDIAPRSYGAQHDYIFDALYSLDVRAFRTRAEVDAALAKNIPGNATRQFLMKNLSREKSGMFKWKMNLDSIHKNYNEIYRTVEGTEFPKPALFIRGSKSDYVRDDDIIDIKRLFPNALVATIHDAGHWVHADAAEEFTKVALDFLQNQS